MSTSVKRVLLTGIGGFVGSHFMDHLLVNTDWHIVGVASWRHKGIPERVYESIHYKKNKDRVTMVTHDLVSPFSQFTKEKIGKIDFIINVASESHVDRSITDPVGFIKNNVDLVLNILEYAREAKPKVFIQISTDEVFGSAPEDVDFGEWSTILPSNPYAASKAAQEAIAIAYWRTYQVPLIITNTMNNFGERQDKEKFIPLVIRKVVKGEKVTIHSYPDKKRAGSRFYLHARNHADGVLFLINKLVLKGKGPAKFGNGVDRPDRFNIVGEKEVDNLSMAQFIAKVLGRKLIYELVDFHTSRPGHDTRYSLDGSKIAKMGWKPPFSFEQSLKKTIKWYLIGNNKRWLGL